MLSREQSDKILGLCKYEKYYEDDEGYFTHPYYAELINAFGYEVVSVKDSGDYQGDYFYILRNGSSFGWLVFGYGSCSGCDSMQACNTPAEVLDLAMRLENNIIWHEDAAGLKDYLENKDHEGEFYGYRSSWPEMVEEMIIEMEASPYAL